MKTDKIFTNNFDRRKKPITTIALILTSVLAVVSLIFFVASFLPKNCFSSCIDSSYNTIGMYAGLYKFLFVSIAALLTLVRLNQTEEENKRRWEKEIKQETLKHCHLYLSDLQEIYSKLTDLLVQTCFKTDYPKLNQITRIELKEKYEILHNKIGDLEKDKTKEIIHSLLRLNSFAAIFLLGNLDLKLGKQVIGKLYCDHMKSLKGFIAYFTPPFKPDEEPPDPNQKLFINIIELVKVWEKEDGSENNK